jgi:tetratricopeptide (TPR) repeat protein
MKRWMTAVCLAGMLAPAASARADTPPGIWDYARSPSLRGRWDLHVRIERLLHDDESDDPIAAELRLEAARALLDEAGIDGSAGQDVLLRLDLGTVYERLARAQKRADLHARAADVLSRAIDEAPDGEGVTAALSELVFAYVRLGRPRDELAAWRRYLARIVDDRSRIVPLIDMGEAEMRLGQVDDALATFREAIRLCEQLSGAIPVSSTYALALWDVAVALDRAGDPGGALRTSAQAIAWNWRETRISGRGQGARVLTQTITGWDVLRDDEEVFFVPDWERDWYLALGYAAQALAASDPRAAAAAWRDAERHWEVYVNGSSAAPERDPWLGVARARLQWARAARERADRRSRPAARVENGR